MTFQGCSLDDTITIDKLYTVHYYEFSNQYRNSGENHNFWKMIYVDKGKITVVTDKTEHQLEQGDIIFHKPGERHELKTNGTTSPNIVVISFDCASDAMKFFENKITSLNQGQKKIVSRILAEYSNTFSTPLNMPENGGLEFKPAAAIGGAQLLRQVLSEFLISLLRSSLHPSSSSYLLKTNTSDTLLNLLMNYMEANICKSICLNDLISYSGASKATITKTFKSAFGMGAVEYFLNMKINYSKHLLQEETYNITQIADILGYSGIHYFSRQFKKITGMSPSEYLQSITS